MIGGLLAVLVLFLFLNDFKSTLIVAVIPMSVIMTFAPLNLSGDTNTVLGGLAQGWHVGGLLIVVLEPSTAAARRGYDHGCGADT